MFFLLFTAALGNQATASHAQKTLFNEQEETLYFNNVHNFRDLLEKRELNVNAHDQAGRTLLIAAIEAGRADIAQILIENGVDVDHGTDCAEQPPLHCAIWNFRIDILELLLNNGTQHITHPDADGTIPLCTAAHGGALINKIDDATITAEELQNYIPICQEMIRLLVNNGADINAKNTTGETALHEAVTWGLKGLVQTLVELGADTTVTDNEGKTPLDYADERDYTEIIEILTQPMDA